jgi:hypothetical protein
LAAERVECIADELEPAIRRRDAVEEVGHDVEIRDRRRALDRDHRADEMAACRLVRDRLLEPLAEFGHALLGGLDIAARRGLQGGLADGAGDVLLDRRLVFLDLARAGLAGLISKVLGPQLGNLGGQRAG